MLHVYNTACVRLAVVRCVGIPSALAVLHEEFIMCLVSKKEAHLLFGISNMRASIGECCHPRSTGLATPSWAISCGSWLLVNCL